MEKERLQKNNGHPERNSTFCRLMRVAEPAIMRIGAGKMESHELKDEWNRTKASLSIARLIPSRKDHI